MNAVSNLFIRVGIDLKNPAHVKKMVLVLILVVLIIATAVKYFGGDDVADAADAAGTVSYDVGENATPEATPAGGEAAGTYDAAVPLAANSDIYIDVSGAVEKPCVVCLPAGSRVFDAIDAAGGLSEIADTRTINQAAILEDGQKVYVPTADEVEAGTVSVSSDNVSSDAGAGVGSGGDAVQNGKININKANADDLQQLSGIGPALSQRIIDYRDAHGAFKKIEDIKNVSGIGDKTFEKFSDVITV